MSALDQEKQINALRGSDAWDFGDTVCKRCGAPAPDKAKVVRQLVTAKQIRFQTKAPCTAMIRSGNKMLACGSRDFGVDIVEETCLTSL